MAVVEVSISPLGMPGTGVSEFVAESLKVIRSSGLKHQLTPMGTIIEGSLDDILPVIRKMHEAQFEAGAPRVSTLIKIDDRRDKPSSLEDKVRSVEEKIHGQIP